MSENKQSEPLKQDAVSNCASIADKQIINTRTYTFKLIDYSDGSNMMTRTNEGFNPIELLGYLDFIQREVTDQIRGVIKPDIVKRTVVKD
jgi:hypothetical protein